MQIEPLVLGVKDAAAFIGLSRSRLYELIEAREIEARKLGARTVVPIASLKAVVASSPLVREAA
jgi:excisionase family DNA binding protein